jgi:ribonuclease HII
MTVNYQKYLDDEIKNSKFKIIGCDEVGRGSLAGPVVATTAMITENCLNYDELLKIKDSKMIDSKKRGEIYKILIDKIFFANAIISHKIIDKINILQATKMAMLQSYQNFCKKYQILPEILLVDGNFYPFQKDQNLQEIIPIIKGDQKSIIIAAASIIAKETRDSLMKNEYHKTYPQYDFINNSGYLTKKHRDALDKYGFCNIHRKSFEPIKSNIISSLK